MPPEIKWIKIVTSIFDDEKIRLIERLPEADTILIIWFKLLVQAGKVNRVGYVFLDDNKPFTDEMLSTLFSRPLNTIRLALNILQDYGLIEIEERGILIKNWGKHQSIDALEKIRNSTRQRAERFRNKQKLLASGNVTETLRNGIRKKKEEIDKEKGCEDGNPFEGFQPVVSR